MNLLDWILTVLFVLFLGVPVFWFSLIVVLELVAYIMVFIKEGVKGGVKGVLERFKKQKKAVE